MMRTAIEPGKCDVCGNLHDGRCVLYDQLRAELADLELSPEEDRHLRWLAKWDRSTVGAFVSLFRKLRSHYVRLPER